MTPTRTIPITRDPKSLQLEADEAQMVRMAEIQDHMFYNRVVNGMKGREVRSSSLPAYKGNEYQQCTSFMEKLPSTAHHSHLPVSILMSPSRSRRPMDFESQTPSCGGSNSLSSSPANPLLMPGGGENFSRAQLSSVLTQSLQILEDDVEEDELMFEMEF